MVFMVLTFKNKIIMIYELLMLISIFAVLKAIHFLYKRFNIWFDKSVFIEKEPSQESNVNDLPFESLEYMAKMIMVWEGENTDCQLKILARYQTIVNKKELPKPILPEGFTIEYNEYNKKFYPKYNKKYLYRIAKGLEVFDFKKPHEMDLDYVPHTKAEAIDVIKQYNCLNLGNVQITIIK